MNKRALIIENALKTFKQSGIRKVSMDQLAKLMHMSKKTLYQYFKDKSSLVVEAFTTEMNNKKAHCMAHCSVEGNAIDQFLKLSQFANNNLKEQNPQVVHDIARYYPECHKILYEFTHGFILEFLNKNLEQGIAQGYYRKDLRTELVSAFYIYLVNGLLPQNISNTAGMDLAEIHNSLYTYHLHAICSEQGIEYLKSKTQQ